MFRQTSLKQLMLKIFVKGIGTVDGALLYIYNDEWDKGFGLYNGAERKKGFYMYKSYQRVS